jgi:hypothetical protein
MDRTTDVSLCAAFVPNRLRKRWVGQKIKAGRRAVRHSK